MHRAPGLMPADDVDPNGGVGEAKYKQSCIHVVVVVVVRLVWWGGGSGGGGSSSGDDSGGGGGAPIAATVCRSCVGRSSSMKPNLL